LIQIYISCNFFFCLYLFSLLKHRIINIYTNWRMHNNPAVDQDTLIYLNVSLYAKQAEHHFEWNIFILSPTNSFAAESNQNIQLRSSFNLIRSNERQIGPIYSPGVYDPPGESVVQPTFRTHRRHHQRHAANKEVFGPHAACTPD